MTQGQAAYSDYVQAYAGMYLYNLGQWKKMCEQAAPAANGLASSSSSTAAQVQAGRTPSHNFYAHLHRRFVESQIGVCQFFEKRWSSHLALPEMAASLKSPFDLLHLQAAFLKTLAEDYTNQSVRMLQNALSPAPRHAPARIG